MCDPSVVHRTRKILSTLEYSETSIVGIRKDLFKLNGINDSSTEVGTRTPAHAKDMIQLPIIAPPRGLPGQCA